MGKAIFASSQIPVDISNYECFDEIIDVGNKKIKIEEADIEEFKKALRKTYVVLDNEERKKMIGRNTTLYQLRKALILFSRTF